jgi:hypothetical protein
VKRRQELFQLEKHLILPSPKDICQHGSTAARVRTSWVIVTFGEAGDTVCFRMYIMSYEP